MNPGSAAERLALAGWSLHRRFRRADRPLSLLAFPRVAREEFGLARIEVNSPFFEYAEPDRPAGGPVNEGFLGRLRERADAAGVRIMGVAVDGHGDLSSLNEDRRRLAVRQHLKWVDICTRLGCSYFRANSGAKGVWWIRSAHEQACVRSFAELADRTARAGISVLMENHWGLSKDPNRMARVIRAVDNPACGTLADFRNWPKRVDPYEALAVIAPHAGCVHAKFLSFDAEGNDPAFDTPRALNILRQVSFNGPFAIEFEGRLDDHEGVLRSKQLLERLL